MKTHKKIKATEHYLRLPMLRCSLHVMIAKDITKANKKLDLIDYKDIDLSEAAGFTTSEMEKGWTLIMLKSNVGHNEIAHEALHFANNIFKYIGYDPSVENDEFQAALMGYVCENLAGFLKKHKKKFKKQKS